MLRGCITGSRFKTLFLLAVIFWTLLIGLLASWQYEQSHVAALETARSAARNSFTKDIISLHWATRYGGVYVPVTPDTPPSPYLVKVPERDIFTESGNHLTLIDPAYTTRQIHKIGEQEHGVRGKLTSLNPMRMENAPDPWEREALMAFDRTA